MVVIFVDVVNVVAVGFEEVDNQCFYLGHLVFG